ncbi:FAD-binding oxidoreductase [Mesorhizobium sp. CAU 1741]|uniref:FAD-binding oxidoreductase n=1 Tax=Mesorhizobium sp. CAU 1741 TaxID=3140366 RepID=UPI00325A4816
MSSILDRTPSIKSFFFDVGTHFRHIAGQHMVVRLTDPDGYSVMRSYSIASAPAGDGIIELAIERLADGEVSHFFHDVVEVGDAIELRGPLGGHFIWSAEKPGTSLLIGGGSGVVPLISMARQRRTGSAGEPMGLLLSARSKDDAPFFDELVEMDAGTPGFSFTATFTREPPVRAADFDRRLDEDMIRVVLGRLGQPPDCTFICGSNRFVNAAADSVLAAGIPAETVRTERYGG